MLSLATCHGAAQHGSTAAPRSAKPTPAHTSSAWSRPLRARNLKALSQSESESIGRHLLLAGRGKGMTVCELAARLPLLGGMAC